ncbi:MAG: hypothetical protein U0414_20280 [Polyangiaceae bacterium]
MKRPIGSALVALTLSLAVPLGCHDEVINPLPGKVHVARSKGCNPLGYVDVASEFDSPVTCTFPFPSFWVEREDPASPTRARVNLSPEELPVTSPALDPAPYDLADGFSPVTPIGVHFGFDVDTSELAGLHTAERSLAADAKVVLLDLETGKHVLHFVEMDQNRSPEFPNRYALVIRPIEPMEMGHRHAVVLRTGMVDTAGHTIAPTPAFAALRDGAQTDNEDVEGVRSHMNALFEELAANGVSREDLLLAFDFHVASKDWLLGPVLSMRAQGLDAIQKGELGYTIETVTPDPNPNIAKIVLGKFEVPTFIDDNERIVWDASHAPVRQPSRSYPFTMLVPKRSETDGPLPLVVLGHGIFGNGRDFLTSGGDGDAIQKLAQDFGGIVVATDWIGLSSNDLPRIGGEVAPDLNHIDLITDQLQQALINAVTLTKLALGPLKDDPMAKTAGGPLVDTSRVYYWGASLGGIEGSSFVSISPDIQRAAFGVPGSAWSTMLTRSIVFTPVKSFIEIDFPDPLDQMFLTTIAQARFDHSDPANVTRLMFKDPLPDVPSDRLVLLQESIGDSQVPNLATDILVRSMGAKLLAPAFYEPAGVELVSAPTTAPVVTQFRMQGWTCRSRPRRTNRPLPTTTCTTT